MKNPGIVDVYAQRVFLGELKRPLADYALFEASRIPPDCPVLGTGWHELGTVSEVEMFFDIKGIPVEILLPPDPRLARRGLMTHGFVVLRR